MIPNIINELWSKSLLTISDNAIMLFTSGNKSSHSLMVIKSDGAYGYDTIDLAAIWYWLLELKAD